jgi:iron complex outermembrane receptor protein
MQRIAAHALVVAAVSPSFAFGSEETLLEEIVVTASFVGVNESSATRPIHVLDGQAVTESGIQSLGEHVDALLGVSSADFGGAVGQPIIRGMSGNRVKVLNNGTVIRDVSALGPDHAVDVSLNDVKQVEIVRGPSALMYSNGSIGGIVNVVDNSIPTTDLEGFSGTVGAEAQSVNDGEAVDLTLRGNVGGLNLTYSYQDVDMEDYEIPKGAVIDMHEGHHDEEHEDEHEDHDEEHEEGHEEGHDMDKLANSDVSTTSHRIGLSTTGDWGYVGLSYSDLSSTYGIPFHSEAAHEGHGDEHEGEHEEGHEEGHEEDHEEGHDDGDDHHDEDDHAGHDEHGEERIFSKTESEIIALSGSFKTSIPFLNAIDFAVKNTDYELMEQHAEGEEEEGHEGHDHAEGPTVFSNEATEISVAFDLSAGERIRRVVLNYAEEEISIIGEEAFMAPVDSTETTLGFFSSDDLGFATLDLGLRFDQVDRDGFVAEMHHDEDHGEEHEGDHDEDHEGEHEEHHEGEMVYEAASFSDEVFSAAATLRRDLNEHSSLSLSLASVSKTPSAVELFMNGEHLASSRYEVGDITLDTERSDNIDLAFNFDYHNFFGSASIYYNRVDNYIYLRDELEEEHEAHMEEEHEGDHHDEHHDDEHFDHGGLILSEYSQQDAEFTGYEIEIGTRFELPRGELELILGRDEVDAEFTNGGDVPRLVPARNMFAARYTLSDFSAKLLVKDVERQTSVAPGESATDGFTLVNADASWSYGFNDSTRLTLTAFARNLTDEVARNHSSFVKDQVPLPGRNIGVRVRLDF